MLNPLFSALGPLGQRYGAAASSDQDLIDAVDAFFKLDELSTGVAPVTRVDSKNGFDLTDINNVASAPGLVYARAATFLAAQSESLARTPIGDINPSNQKLSAAIWFRRTGTESFPNMMGTINFNVARGWSIELDSTAPALRVYVQTLSSGGQNGQFSHTPDTSWHLIGFNYDGAGATNADRLKVWLDGVQKVLAFGNGDIPTTVGDAAGLWLGTLTGLGRHWNGDLGPAMLFIEDNLTDAQHVRLNNGGAGLAFL